MKSLTDNINLTLLELLSVLLPGGLMITLLNRFYFFPHFINLPAKNTELTWPEVFMNFGFAYFLGYSLYVGSSFLDNWYNFLKLKAVGKGKENRYSKIEKRDVRWWARYFILPNVHNTHNLINEIIKYKVYYLGNNYEDAEPIDAYQWSYRYLMNKHERMFSEVERYYSTAKFFRSMTLLFFISAIFYIFKDSLGAGISIGLCILSFYLFLNRWQKANHVAFKNVIILESFNNSVDKENQEVI